MGVLGGGTPDRGASRLPKSKTQSWKEIFTRFRNHENLENGGKDRSPHGGETKASELKESSHLQKGSKGSRQEQLGGHGTRRRLPIPKSSELPQFPQAEPQTPQPLTCRRDPEMVSQGESPLDGGMQSKDNQKKQEETQSRRTCLSRTIPSGGVDINSPRIRAVERKENRRSDDLGTGSTKVREKSRARTSMVVSQHMEEEREEQKSDKISEEQQAVRADRGAGEAGDATHAPNCEQGVQSSQEAAVQVNIGVADGQGDDLRLSSTPQNGRTSMEQQVCSQESLQLRGEPSMNKKDKGEAEGSCGTCSEGKTDGELRTGALGEQAGKRRAGGPADKMESRLASPVELDDLAVTFGLNRYELEEAASNEDNKLLQKAAEQELSTLKGIQQYLTAKRKQIKRAGDRFLVPLERIPCRLLAIEKRRIDALSRANHKKAHNYTDYSRGQIFRFPAPGCGGAPINIVCARSALPAHCNAYHRAQAVHLTYKVQLARGWEYHDQPPKREGRERGIPSCNLALGAEASRGRETDMSNADCAQKPDDWGAERPQKNMDDTNRVISALRLSVFPDRKTASETANLPFLEEGEEEVRGMGVHAIVPAGAKGRREIREIGEPTWRGKRKVNAIGDKEIPVLDGAKKKGEDSWAQLAPGECQQAILNMPGAPAE